MIRNRKVFAVICIVAVLVSMTGCRLNKKGVEERLDLNKPDITENTEESNTAENIPTEDSTQQDLTQQDQTQ